ncbi:MAG: pseudouridine synthase [Propionicimonas sp.]|uniref:pseudouridine synthase n=1 Tax=Propionicimonas sp. TaxID=1955623 RepID=UPI002B1F32F4|nr:pseudouridine synthase [Propionicimonas sp.]MEA4944041.1 pseudouridine synthase [Propionicimonas sp.]MEA5118568.1 pseudouridine synthase [Propionicimonas sp.]
MTPETDGVRLQKVLARAGVASRRASEELIARGRVEVNGQVVNEQGLRVDPARDVIRVDGARIPPERSHAYLVLNKPRGVVSTMDDPQGRPTLQDYLGRRRGERLFHVGRLDADTEGLLILTNDGDFAQRLTHPSYEIPKTYVAVVAGSLEHATLAKLRRGVTLEDGPIRPDRIRLVQRERDRSMVEITLHSGRNRIVRRLFEAVGHPVRELARTAIGPIRLGHLKSGEVRDLTSEELGKLLDTVGL